MVIQSKIVITPWKILPYFHIVVYDLKNDSCIRPDNELGERFTRQTIEAVEQMDIPESEKKKIFEDNVKTLLELSI